MNTVVVTGVSRGLGLVIANRFAAEAGWRVVGLSRSERPSELAENIEYFTVDASKSAAVEQFWGDLAGSIDGELVLVNNAGGFVGGSVTDSSIEDFTQQMAINYFTGVHMTKLAVKAVTSAEVRIVNIISAVALVAAPSNVAYGASKTAAMRFYQALQGELNDERYKITNIYPDAIATSGADAPGIKPADLAQYVYWQVTAPTSFYVRDVTLFAV